MSVTAAEQYLQDLWSLYSENMPTTVILLPTDENIYEIDLNTRVVKAPSFLGVKKDQGAETIYFVIDRFAGEIDLANTACIIQYKNDKGADSFYPVPFYDITTYSSHVIDQAYIEVTINSGLMEDNDYYILDNNHYILNTEPYNPNQTYYVKNNSTLNQKYVPAKDVTVNNYKPNFYYILDNKGEIVELTANTYIPNKYYILNPITNTYELATGVFEIDKIYYSLKDTSFKYELATGPFDENETYYLSIDKRALQVQVESANYKRNTYFYLNQEGDLVLATDNFNPNRTYYTIVDKPKMLFPWTLTNQATQDAGVLQFSIRFYQVDNETGQLVYNLSTLPAQSKILDTLEVEISDNEFEDVKNNSSGHYYDILGREATVLEDLYFKIAAKNDIYWIEA